MKLLSGKLFLLVLLLSSCYTGRIHNEYLTGDYSKASKVISANNSFDKTWDTVIDFFAQKKVAMTIVDKSSGLLVAKKRFTKDDWTYELSGKPENPNAFVVVNTCKLIKGFDFKQYHPEVVEGEWNIRIKATDEKTLININLFMGEVKGKPVMYDGSIQYNPCIYEAKSTGVLERSLAEIFAGQ